MSVYKKIAVSSNKYLTKNKLNRYKKHKPFDLMTSNGGKLRFSENINHKPIVEKRKGEVVSLEELESYEPKNSIEEEYYDEMWS